ncbi:fungal-specific transcription factor domain-containing protein [Aspergillus pseudotamarii]|uniref:Fungal-specific transcription factor domain-containing protein n=1 Tax=Aspergillus pseudotamarii TaxID=132259 RepID=A0A5N6SS85_ASPPS|nr:fungal-specific transcription factor domain-containing protein [Aspergillus pseudotamarii]KAE8136243.1 fungal-specific transcription factor domain-containing protein [Aspergillus pseudotamarii]
MQNPARDAGIMPSWGALDSSSVSRQGMRLSNGHGLANRRRNPLACEMCYKKKVKCEVEGSDTACIQCMRRNITCKFTTRKEKRDNLKRTNYVKNLEERLRKTESLLRAAGLLDDEDMSQLDSGGEDGNDSSEDENSIHVANEESNAPSGSGLSSKSAGRSQKLPWDSTLHQPPLFRYDPREDSRYYGRSSFLSILSRDGIEWIKSKTGDSRFLTLLLEDKDHDSPWDHWRPDVFHDVFSSTVFKPLPPRAEVFSLLKDYFRTVNRLFPLYHEATFMQLVEWQYTQQTCDDAARWASINIILSLAYEYRFSNCQKSERDREKAWLYYKNAMSVFAELTLRRTDILSVQALIGMALFLRGNSGTQSASPIITAAIRACQRMGLHRDVPRPHLSQAEQEQRKRVFWVAYILDQSACIRTGSSPTQHPDDLDIGFPEVDTDDEFTMHGNASFFRQICHMTLIRSRIYSKLYAVKALQKMSPKEIYKVVRELREELEEWHQASPFTQKLKPRGASEDFLVGFATAGLQFGYFNSMIMIHRLPLTIHFAYVRHSTINVKWDVDHKTIFNESTKASSICVQAARDTLKLVNNLPWGDIAWIWSLLYYIFLAVTILFTYILRDSQHPNAREDLQHLSMAATFFATLIPGDGPCNYAKFMTKMCANFERVARAVVEREQKALKSSDTHHQPVASSVTTQERNETSSPSREQVSHLSSTGHVDIPQLEGLPRINSSGYVVPESPSAASEDTPTADQPTVNDPLLGGYPVSQAHESPSATIQQSYQYPMDDTFPAAMADDIQQPELWQIPMTADWEFGSQFLSLFGPQFFDQGGSDVMSAMAGMTAPSMPSAPMNMGFNCDDSDNAEDYPAWMPRGFMNLF